MLFFYVKLWYNEFVFVGAAMENRALQSGRYESIEQAICASQILGTQPSISTTAGTKGAAASRVAEGPT